MTTETRGDFYEDDEPIEDIRAIWEKLPHGFTQRPTKRWELDGCELTSDSVVGTPTFGGRAMQLVDWVEDETLSADETRARFAALEEVEIRDH